MQKGQTLIFLLVGILILATIGGAFYLGRSTIPKPSPTPVATFQTPQPTRIPQPASTTDETANWKTYTNTATSYTLKLPDDWTIEDNQGVFLGIPGEVVFVPPSQKDVQFGQTHIAITAMRNQEIRYSLNTPEQFTDWLTKPISNGSKERLYKVANVKLSNNNAVEFISRTLPGDATESFYSIVTWLNKDDVNYYIELGGDESLVKQFLPIYNQILSTFKFTQ